MSDMTTISASERERVGKGSARAARRAGLVPAVIYGNRQDPVGITMQAREITKIVHQPGIFGRLLEIDVAGAKSTVLTRDIKDMLVDRYSERVESHAELSARVNTPTS